MQALRKENLFFLFFSVSASRFTWGGGIQKCITLRSVGKYLLIQCKHTCHMYQRCNTFDARLRTVKDGVSEVPCQRRLFLSPWFTDNNWAWDQRSCGLLCCRANWLEFACMMQFRSCYPGCHQEFVAIKRWWIRYEISMVIIWAQSFKANIA